MLNLTSVAGDPNKPMLWDVPYYLILNTVSRQGGDGVPTAHFLAGWYVQAVDGPWPKPENASTLFPTRFSIDSVKVLTKAA